MKIQKLTKRWIEFNLLETENADEIWKSNRLIDEIGCNLTLLIGNDLMSLNQNEERHVIIYPGILEVSIIPRKYVRTKMVITNPGCYHIEEDLLNTIGADIRLIWVSNKELFNSEGDDVVTIQTQAWWSPEYGLSTQTLFDAPVTTRGFILWGFKDHEQIPKILNLPISQRLAMMSRLSSVLKRALFARAFPVQKKKSVDSCQTFC